MSFCRHVPPKDHPLAPYVIAIFRMRGRGLFGSETIVPKGNVDVLFNRGEPLHLVGDRLGSHRVGGTAARVAGLQTRSLVSRPEGGVDLVGVSLRAETCAALIPVPLDEITDRALDAPLVFPELRDLSDRLWEVDSFTDQCDLITGWLLGRLRSVPAVDLVRHACTLLRQSPEENAVRRAAAEMAVSPRHLRRLFGQCVGISPSDYMKLGRFVDALHLLSAPKPRLTSVAYKAGYYDQAHFCRDFRQFVGMAPIEYRSRRTPSLVGHIFSP